MALYKDSECAVFSDNNFKSEIKGLSIDSIKAVPTARVIGAPVETGQISFDNKVLDPYNVIVKCTVMMDDIGKEAMNKLWDMFENRKFEFYSVANDDIGYSDLTLVQMPHERNYEKYDWVQFEIVFTKVLLVQKDKSKSKSLDSENSDFRRTGYSSGVAA